jgi:hypothetical protein
MDYRIWVLNFWIASQSLAVTAADNQAIHRRSRSGVLTWTIECAIPVMADRSPRPFQVVFKMIYLSRIYVVILLVATASPARSQESAGELPDVDELLNQAREQISLLDKVYERSDRHRRTAVLYGRLGDVEAAFDAIERTSLQQRPYPATVATAKRERYLNMVEAIASQRNGLAAIKVVDEAPKAYHRHSDDAYGRIALTAACERDADRAWQAISRIKKSDGLYPYELVVATTLEDKARAREVLLGEHKSYLDALAGRIHLAREEWAAIVGTLSLYKWCELEKESEELIKRACATTDDPEKTRAEVMTRLNGEPAEGSMESKGTVANTPIAVEDIRSMLAAANRSERPSERADLLLDAAEEVLRFKQLATAPGSD